MSISLNLTNSILCKDNNWLLLALILMASIINNNSRIRILLGTQYDREYKIHKSEGIYYAEFYFSRGFLDISFNKNLVSSKLLFLVV